MISRAMDSADTIARRVLGERPDLKDRHYFILLTNEDGEEVCRLPLEIIHYTQKMKQPSQRLSLIDQKTRANGPHE